jgi:hypothetical protein
MLMLVFYAIIWVECIFGIGTLSTAGALACSDERWLVWVNPTFSLIFAIFAIVGVGVSMFVLIKINNVVRAVTDMDLESIVGGITGGGGGGGEGYETVGGEEEEGEYEDETTSSTSVTSSTGSENYRSGARKITKKKPPISKQPTTPTPFYPTSIYPIPSGMYPTSFPYGH